MRRAGGGLLAALLSVLWFSATAFTGLELRDEGRILLRSQRVVEKSLPNVDFSDVYGPGVTALNGLLLWAFDRRIEAVRWSLVAVKAIAVAAVWVASRELAGAGIAAAATAFALLTFGRASWNLNTPYGALYVLALGLVAEACLLRARAGGRVAAAAGAGMAVGVALLFKHSLAAMYGVALGTSVLAAMLLEPGRPRGRGARVALSVAFATLLVLPLAVHAVPFGFVGPVDYALFFLPVHALGALVLLVPPATGAGPGLGPRALVASAAGLAVAPLAVALLYASRGGLAAALADLARWPPLLVGYAAPVGIPTPAHALVFAAPAAFAVAAALALGRRWRPAVVAGAAAAAAGAALLTRVDPPPLAVAADAWAPILPSVLAWATLAVCVPALHAPAPPPWLVPAVIASLFLHATSFQIFPRAGYNVLLALPALAPAVAVVLAAAWRSVDRPGLRGVRRWLAFACLTVPVGTLAIPAAVSVMAARAAPRVPLPFEEARGLSVREDAAADIEALRAVVAYLQARPQSPVFLLSNDAMVLFLARRRDMFPRHDLVLQLMGDRMLDRARVPESALGPLVATLERARDPLVVVKLDGRTRNMRHYLPRLSAYLGRRFTTALTAGEYQVLRRRDAVTPPGRAPAA